jgi:hypothetical protein
VIRGRRNYEAVDALQMAPALTGAIFIEEL